MISIWTSVHCDEMSLNSAKIVSIPRVSIPNWSIEPKLARIVKELVLKFFWQNLKIRLLFMHENGYFFKFCRKVLRTSSLTTLVNLDSTDQLWIETLGIDTIFALLRHILSQYTQLYQNQPLPTNMKQNQTFLATVLWRTQCTSKFFLYYFPSNWPPKK